MQAQLDQQVGVYVDITTFRCKVHFMNDKKLNFRHIFAYLLLLIDHVITSGS